MRFAHALTLLVAAILGTAIPGSRGDIVQFIFGDSLSDVGNNNYLSKGLAKADLPWYGIDFGSGSPNGRFSNGRTVADIVGDKTGLPRPPAFLDPSLTEDVIMQNGVNYASGGGGILNDTGSYFIQRFSMYRQIELFMGTKELIKEKIGADKAEEFFRKSLYVVALGSNDFINNYLMPIYSDSWTYNDNSFISFLTETFREQLTLLHSLGVRRLLVFGLGPMGCIPLQRVLGSSGECQERTNNLALSFNQAVGSMVSDLSSKLPNASYRFGDAYDTVNDLISNPSKYGFTNSNSPCCSWGKIRPALTCIPISKLCKDRSKYVFWDEYHPSDSANELIANEIIRKMGFSRADLSDAPSAAPSVAPPHE